MHGITLPLISRTALLARASKMTTSTTPERQRILAVDDHEDILELIRMTLEPTYDIVTLTSPVDIFELMDLFEPDLLILDVMMPRVTGFQLIELMRRSPSTKELPIIVLSAKSSAGEIKHGYKLGATMYLTKPFQPDRLLKNVETQFKVHPPPRRKKTNEANTILMQLQEKQCFKKGMVKLGTSLNNQQDIINARRKFEEKIIRETREAREAQKDN
ncbi:hypothetical protein BH09SUM1_BH09SUM1_21030 [soil metagenome]